jgi:hypothetical protein
LKITRQGQLNTTKLPFSSFGRAFFSGKGKNSHARSENGSADYLDLYVKRRIIDQGNAFLEI